LLENWHGGKPIGNAEGRWESDRLKLDLLMKHYCIQYGEELLDRAELPWESNILYSPGITDDSEVVDGDKFKGIFDGIKGNTIY